METEDALISISRIFLAYTVKTSPWRSHLERLYRGTGSRNCRVYCGNKRNGAAGSDKVWNQQVDGTYGGNKIERFVWVVR